MRWRGRGWQHADRATSGRRSTSVWKHERVQPTRFGGWGHATAGLPSEQEETSLAGSGLNCAPTPTSKARRTKREDKHSFDATTSPPLLLVGVAWFPLSSSCLASQVAVSRVTVSWRTLMREREAASMVRTSDGNVGTRGCLRRGRPAATIEAAAKTNDDAEQS